MAGNTASNSSRRRWISGGLSCDKTSTERQTGGRGPKSGFDPTAHSGGASPRPARSPQDSRGGPYHWQNEYARRQYAYGQRQRRHAHPSGTTSGRHHGYHRKSQSSEQGRSARGASATNEPRRLASSGRVHFALAEFLGHLLSS